MKASQSKTGSDYISKEEVEKLFDKFWDALRNDLQLPRGAGLSRKDEGKRLVDQLVEDLEGLAESHAETWTYKRFDVSLEASLYFLRASSPLQ